MSTIVKLADISLTKLNNAEFTYFAGQIISYIDAATVEALHVDAATFAGFKGNHGRLVDIVAQSRAAEETAKIGEADKQEDNLLSYLFATVKGACSHPIAAKREAAQAVYAVMKPYQGVQSLPQRQQVQTVDGLVLDLEKEATAAHLTTFHSEGNVRAIRRAGFHGLGVQRSRAVGRVERFRRFGEQADCRHEYGVQPADGAAEEGRRGDGMSRLAALS